MSAQNEEPRRPTSRVSIPPFSPEFDNSFTSRDFLFAWSCALIVLIVLCCYMMVALELHGLDGFRQLIQTLLWYPFGMMVGAFYLIFGIEIFPSVVDSRLLIFGILASSLLYFIIVSPFLFLLKKGVSAKKNV